MQFKNVTRRQKDRKKDRKIERKKDTTQYRAISAQLELGWGLRWVAVAIGAELSNSTGRDGNITNDKEDAK